MATFVSNTPNFTTSTGRVDFVKQNFDNLIIQKGYDVIHEKSLRCPCVSKNSNQLSSCKNCGGSSWIFINPKLTRMVIHSMNLNTKYKEWSQENIGTASISALAEDETSFMDRITVKDGIAIFTEVMFLKNYNDIWYWNTIYNIKEIIYIGLFKTVDEPLLPLVYGTDFIYVDNKITFLTANIYIDPLLDEQDISISVRYKHSPQLHIIDSPRETMQSFINIAGAGEEEINLPVHSIGRRSHYVLDRQNFDNTRIVNNSIDLVYDNMNPKKLDC